MSTRHLLNTMTSRVPRTRAGGRWTEARFNAFIKSALRAASRKWPPKADVKKAARVERGKYRCAGYKRKSHVVPVSLPPPKGKKRRVDNAVVDHIVPVIDPSDGRTTWDSVIERLFVEADGLQVLCHDCHTRKTTDERDRRSR